MLTLSVLKFISLTNPLIIFNKSCNLMMLFSTGTGLERVGVVWPDLAYWRAGLQAPRLSGLRLDRYNVKLQALDVALLCKNNKEGGSTRASPMAALMPKSVSF